MRGKKPERSLSSRAFRHGSGPAAGVVLLVMSGLAAASFAVGLLIALGVFENKGENRELLWAETMAAQAHAAAIGLADNTRAVRQQVELLAGLDARELKPRGGIVHWAEIEWMGGVPDVRRSGVNPDYANGFPEPMQRSYLAGVLRKITSSKPEVFRFKKDPLQPTEWLAMGFASGSPQRMHIALVDPVRAFSVFQTGDESGQKLFRRYLLAKDGRVLTHSQPTFVGSDFASTELFRQVNVAESVPGVLARAESLDRLQIRAAFWFPEGVPAIGVVERVIDEKAERVSIPWRGVAGMGLIAFGALTSFVAFAAYLVMKFSRGGVK